jgi:hypothetical protein
MKLAAVFNVLALSRERIRFVFSRPVRPDPTIIAENKPVTRSRSGIAQNGLHSAENKHDNL